MATIRWGIPQWLQQRFEQLRNWKLTGCPRSDNRHTHSTTSSRNFLQNFGYNWDPAAGTLNGATYDTYTNPGQIVVLGRAGTRTHRGCPAVRARSGDEPRLAAIQWLISLELFDWPLHIEEIAVFLSQNPALFAAVIWSPALAPIAAPVVRGAGRTGRAGAAGGAVAPHRVRACARIVYDRCVRRPTVLASAVAPSAPAPTTTAATPASPAAGPPPPTAPPPPAAGPGFSPPYVVGGPTMESWMSAKAKTREPTSRGASRAPVIGARRSRPRPRSGHGRDGASVHSKSTTPTNSWI